MVKTLETTRPNIVLSENFYCSKKLELQTKEFGHLEKMTMFEHRTIIMLVEGIF